MPAPDRALDKRGGPGHSVLLLVILTLPALKVAWTVGEGTATRDIVATMGLANWPNIVVGMMLSDPAFASLLAIAVSRISFGYFAARGAVPRGDDAGVQSPHADPGLRLTDRARRARSGCSSARGGRCSPPRPRPSCGTALSSNTARDAAATTPERRAASTTWERRSTTAGHLAALVLTAVVLPVVALADAFDGRAWAPRRALLGRLRPRPAPRPPHRTRPVGNGTSAGTPAPAKSPTAWTARPRRA
ncbi:hypothetical protein ACU686_23215 [Yinghuangia aomiensis]